MVWCSQLFKNFLQFVVIHTVKGFSIVSEAAVDVFWNSLAFSMIQWMLAIWSLVPLLFLNQLYIWKFSVHVLLKPSLKDFEHNLASMWNESSCAVVWTFFGIVLLSVQFSRSVMSDSFATPWTAAHQAPRPSPTPRACSDSSSWCP